MGRALYRKYRSKNLSEIVGQEHITTALKNALKSGAISHAYLFTGPRGTGKTSIARILAHEINNLPYDEAATHLDIIEIDAASNRRIDEIRTLRERVHNAPTSAKYKVYIIDEVHMLTKEAFNALLKTLEEPPEHVIFILATTEAHKLPETIISRTQRYSFKPAEVPATIAHLRNIAKSEGITISDDALELVARHGRGSFRDSISLLDQVSNTASKIDASDVRRSLGIAPEEAIQKLLEAIAGKDTTSLLEQLQDLQIQGYQAPQIARQFGQTLRRKLLAGTSELEPKLATHLMHQLISVPAAHDPHALLEIILLEPTLDSSNPDAPPSVEASSAAKAMEDRLAKTETKKEFIPPKEEPKSKPAPVAEEPTPEPEPTPQPKSAAPTSSDPTSSLLDETGWQQILHTLKQKHNTLYGIARMASPMFDDGTLTLSFAFPFHQKRMNDAKNKKIISDIIIKELDTKVEIVCVADKGTQPAPGSAQTPKEPKPDSSPLDTISNIFGGGEVLD